MAVVFSTKAGSWLSPLAKFVLVFQKTFLDSSLKLFLCLGSDDLSKSLCDGWIQRMRTILCVKLVVSKHTHTHGEK